MATAQLRAPAPVRVVFDGQSHLNIPETYPAPYHAMLGSGIPWHNVAVNGQGWGALVADQSTRLFPQARPSPLVDILVMVGGWSDLVPSAVGPVDGETAHARAVTYAENARAAGFDYVICSTVPGTGPNVLNLGIPTTGQYEEIDTYNALVMADTAGDFDASVDISTAPLDDATNGTYYLFDRLHFLNPGAIEVGARLRAAIDTFL